MQLNAESTTLTAWSSQANLINTIFLVNNISIYQPTSGRSNQLIRVQNLTTSKMAVGAAGPVGVTRHSSGRNVVELRMSWIVIVGSMLVTCGWYLSTTRSS